MALYGSYFKKLELTLKTNQFKALRFSIDFYSLTLEVAFRYRGNLPLPKGDFGEDRYTKNTCAAVFGYIEG